MSITPIQTTSPDQVQAPQKLGGAGGHKGKAPQASQMAHATNAKGGVADFKSQIARELKETGNTTISDESKKKDSGAGNDQPKKPRRKQESAQAESSDETSGLIDIIA